MYRLLSILALLSIYVVGASLSQQDTERALQDLLESYREDGAPAVSLYVWTPETTYSVATGLFDLESGELVTVDSRFRIGSVSKTYTAVVTLQLVDEGLIDLDAPITTYIPDVTSDIDGADVVTTRELLTMTSGLFEYLNDDFFDAVDADPTREWTPIDALEEYVYGELAFFDAGIDFEYTNTNYLLLQLIIEAVTDQPLHEVVREYILEPIEAENTYTQVQETLPGEFVHGYEDLDGDGLLDDTRFIDDGAGMGDGALIADAADVARFYEYLFYEQALLGDATFAEMLTDPLDSDYGMGIEVIEDVDYGTIYGHSGSVLGFTSDARYFADEEIIVVLLHADVELDFNLIWDTVDLIVSG